MGEEQTLAVSSQNPRSAYQIDETRDRIVRTARDFFLEKGLFETQMQELANASGISRTTLYRYFQDKIDLALVVMVQILEELIGNWEDPGPASGLSARVRLGCYLKEIWNAKSSPNLRYLADFDTYYSSVRLTPGFRAKLESALGMGALQSHQRALHDLFREGQRDGSIRADLNPELTMATLINTVRGHQQRTGNSGGEPLVDLLIQGISS